jgi:hypothetical protein
MAPLYNQEFMDTELLKTKPIIAAENLAVPFETPRGAPVQSYDDYGTYTMGEIHKVLNGEQTIDQCLENMQAKGDSMQTLDSAISSPLYLKYTVK